MKKILFGSLFLTSILYPGEISQFNLGEIDISEKSEIENNIEIINDDFKLHNQEDIAQVLNNQTGIFLTNQGGRSEKVISVRGFDSRRISVYVDGIPVSVPYDGNFDYGRFLTSDLSQISVSKGFSSVIYGANTMGGVINLVSKKPTKEIEGEIGFGEGLDNGGDLSNHSSYLNIGSKQDNFYIQFSASMKDQNHFNLSNDFEHTSLQPEDERRRSENEDYKRSLKIG